MVFLHVLKLLIHNKAEYRMYVLTITPNELLFFQGWDETLKNFESAVEDRVKLCYHFNLYSYCFLFVIVGDSRRKFLFLLCSYFMIYIYLSGEEQQQNVGTNNKLKCQVYSK